MTPYPTRPPSFTRTTLNTYNNLNQLVSKKVDNQWDYAYAYDQRGNLVKEDYYQNKNKVFSHTYVYDATNRMVQGTNQAGEISRYVYNGLGVLVEDEWIVENNAYGYHGFDFTPSVPTTVKKPEVIVRDYVIDYSSPVQAPLWETEQGGNDYRYTYGLQRLSAKIFGVQTSAGDIVEPDQTLKLHYHMDRLGSSTHLTDKFGRITSWTYYDEWGQITHNTVVKVGQRQFDLVKNYTGHNYDSVLDLYYAKARMYDPIDKRFAARDLIKGSVAAPMTLNPYLYVVDNPLRYVDLLGLFFDETILRIGQGEKNLETQESKDILRLQIRLQTNGVLSRDFLEYGIFDSKTREAVLLYKNKNRIINSDGIVTGIVDKDMWVHLGLPISYKGSLLAPAPTEEEIADIHYAQTIARAILDIRYKETRYERFIFNGITYVIWNVDNWSLGKYYYEIFQCKLRQQKLWKKVTPVLDLVVSGYDSYQQAIEITGGEPLTTILGTALLFGAHTLFDYEPSFNDFYEATLGSVIDEGVQQSAKMFKLVYLSHLKYVIASDAPIHVHLAAREIIFEAMDEILQQEENGFISSSTKRIALGYLEDILRYTYNKLQREDYIEWLRIQAGYLG